MEPWRRGGICVNANGDYVQFWGVPSATHVARTHRSQHIALWHEWLSDYFLNCPVCTAASDIQASSRNYCCPGKATSITYSERVCSLRYPACSEHAPYCHLWPVRLYNNFPHYIINGTIFEKKKILNRNYAL